MDPRTAAHDGVVADLDLHARDLAAHDVVYRAAFDLTGEAGHHDVAPRLERDVAEESAAVRLEHLDLVGALVAIRRAIVVQLRMGHRLAGMRINHVAGYPAVLIRDRGDG